MAILVLGVAASAATIAESLWILQQGPRAPVVPSASGGRTTTPPSTAAIRARLIDALSGEPDTIFYSQSSTEIPGQPTSFNEEWDYPWNGRPGQVVHQTGSRSVGGTVQSEWSLTFTVPAGGATANAAESTGASCNVSGQRIDIDFINETWQPSDQSCVALTPGLDTAEFVDPKTRQPISNIKTLVADGLLGVVGSRTIGHQSTIELRSAVHGASTLDLWVNASTYLPVQSVTTFPTGNAGASKVAIETTQFSYLMPSPSNLANLQVTIPPGFSEVVSPQG
jgi:hypothetical protein